MPSSDSSLRKLEIAALSNAAEAQEAEETFVASLQKAKNKDSGLVKLYVAPVAYTWACVAQQLVAGAIAWVGAQVFEKLFGGKKADLAELMQAFIVAVQRIVREEIQAQALSELRSHVDQLAIDFLHYQNAPGAGDRLAFITNNASFVTTQLPSYGILGHHAYMTALTLQVIVLQEREKLLAAEKANVVETLCRGIAVAGQMHEGWRIWYDETELPKYRYSWHKYSKARLPDGTWSGGAFRITYNEVHLTNRKTVQEVHERIANEMQKRWRKGVYLTHVVPSEGIVASWEKLLTQYGMPCK